MRASLKDLIRMHDTTTLTTTLIHKGHIMAVPVGLTQGICGTSIIYISEGLCIEHYTMDVEEFYILDGFI